MATAASSPTRCTRVAMSVRTRCPSSRSRTFATSSPPSTVCRRWRCDCRRCRRIPFPRCPTAAPGGDALIAVSGTQSAGQGHETSFAQVLADCLELPIEKIRLRTGDTAIVKLGGGSHSDRSLRYAATLIVGAARQLIEHGRRAAAERLEARVDDVAYERGSFRIAGTDRAIGLFALAPLEAAEEINARIPAFPAGAAVCELEVEP